MGKLRALWARARKVLASVSWSDYLPGLGGASSAFRGAEFNRLSADRWSATSHPDTEVQYAARALRARARDLVRNDAYAAGAVESIADNVIGWEGIRCKPAVKDAKGEPIRETNWAIEAAWQEWCEQYATVDGVEGWLETERLLAKSKPTDGETFLRLHRGFDNPHGFAVEILDPDLLDEQFNRPAGNGQNEIVMGVEVDAFGRPMTYWFWDHHPDEIGRRQRIPVPASEIVHDFDRYRPGQTRGYSKFAPVLTTVEMGGGALEAELVASRASAAKMGFKTNNTDEAKALWAARMAAQNLDGKEWKPKRSPTAPGIIEELAPGQDFVEFDPTHPNTAFDPFLKVIHRGVARGLSMSYLTFTGDVSAANYSSMRAGLLPERDHWKAVQRIMALRVHGPVYRAWLQMALLSGALKLPAGIAQNYSAVEWRGRRWQWVDPANDLEAAEKEVFLGVNSRERIASDRGLDFEVIVDESKANQEYAKKAGVWVDGAGGPERIQTEVTMDEPPTSNGNGETPAAPKKNGNGKGKPKNRLAPYRHTEAHE